MNDRMGIELLQKMESFLQFAQNEIFKRYNEQVALSTKFMSFMSNFERKDRSKKMGKPSSKIKKRNVILAVSFVLLLYVVYNAIWYFNCYKIYQNYQEGFPEIEDSGTKIYVDDEGYNYSVKVPSYLSWAGNLAITEENINHALIIWPGIFGGDSETGVVLTYESVQYQIELKNKTTAADSEYQRMVDENLEVIALLYEKANDIWGLGLE